MRTCVLVSIVAGTALLVGLLAIPISPASSEPTKSEQLPPLPVKLPTELPAELPVDLPGLDLLNAAGLSEILACVTGGEGGASSAVQAPSPDAVISIILCIGQKLLDALAQAVADLVAAAGEAAPTG
jgi:hypothetical protein